MRVREFADGCEVAQALLVRAADHGDSQSNGTRDGHKDGVGDGNGDGKGGRNRDGSRDGNRTLRLVLGDRTGTIHAILAHNGRQKAAGHPCRPGDVVFVTGTVANAELALRSLRPARDSEYVYRDLHDGPTHDIAQMESDFNELLATVQNPHLRRLLNAVFAETWPGYRDAPAAKRYHQAYRHGLLEHSLTVAQAVGAISATFPGIDRDVAVTGALLHDIGKLDAYELSPGAITMSDHGRLHGEIALGYYRVRRTIEHLDGFPPDLAQAVLHIILSHHGSLEHGSPVVPCTREATLVHMIDNLGGKLGSFDRLEKELPAGAQWSAYDKVLGGGAYFAPRAEADREAA